MKKPIFIIFFISLSLLYSCEKGNDTEIVEISYGTSFGMCIGYCRGEFIIKQNYITFINSGWTDTIETITCTEKLDEESWNSVTENLNTSEFFNLPETIGCPDCADGGAEWIEIEKASGKKHKVTFEYRNEPDELKNYLSILRELIGKAKICEED